MPLASKRFDLLGEVDSETALWATFSILLDDRLNRSTQYWSPWRLSLKNHSKHSWSTIRACFIHSTKNVWAARGLDPSTNLYRRIKTMCRQFFGLCRFRINFTRKSGTCRMSIMLQVTWLPPPRSQAQASGWLQSAVTKTHVMLSSVVGLSRAFSAVCVYSKLGHHPIPYLCANFRFFCGLRCWASPWKKSRTHPLNHSNTQLIWCPGNRSSYASEPLLLAYLLQQYLCVLICTWDARLYNFAMRYFA